MRNWSDFLIPFFWCLNFRTQVYHFIFNFFSCLRGSTIKRSEVWYRAQWSYLLSTCKALDLISINNYYNSPSLSLPCPFTRRKSTYHLMVYTTKTLVSIYEGGLEEFYHHTECFAYPFEKLMKLIIFFRKIHLNSEFYKVSGFTEIYL